MMAPSEQSTQQQSPTADDLLFLLSIVRNPNGFIAEHEQKQKTPSSTSSSNAKKSSKSKSNGGGDGKRKGDGSSSSQELLSWQQIVTSLPLQRRSVILSLQQLATARQKWNNVYNVHDVSASTTTSTSAFGKEENESNYYLQNNALMEDLENAASAIRTCATEYLESIEGYKTALQQFWLPTSTSTSISTTSRYRYDQLLFTSPSELARVGSILTSQFLRQLQWDERLVGHAINAFLDDELYNHEQTSDSNNKNGNENENEKLRLWSDAMTKMIEIDKSYWEFVEREVYDETELQEYEDDENDNGNKLPEFLNGENSTQFIPVIGNHHIPEDTKSEKDHSQGSRSVITEQCTSESDFDLEKKGSSTTSSSLHEGIVYSASVEEAIEAFINTDDDLRTTVNTERNENVIMQQHPKSKNKSITSILLIGEEGCGKSHLLDSIQQRCLTLDKNKRKSSSSSMLKVLRPKYPVDLVGNSIGSTEDRLIALFTYASHVISSLSEASSDKRGNRRCLIMMDDIDRMFSLSNDVVNGESSSNNVDNSGSSTQYHIGRRCKALFVTILDAFCEHWSSGEGKDYGHLLLLCTSRSRCGEVVDRFDRTFTRGQPDEKHRRDLISTCLSPHGNGDDVVAEYEKNCDDDVEAVLSLVVHHSAGRSAFELAQCCREASLSCAKPPAPSSSSTSSDIFKRRLQYLDKMLQTKSPQSLRGGSLDGVVDMRVFTPEELQSMLTTDVRGEIHMPLLGVEAIRAHEALMNVVITPLCRSDEIRALLYGGSGDGEGSMADAKPIRVGALLAGAPGVGKTSLAYHCASLAAKMARVSLLDVSCTSLIHKEIGGSERAVQRLFAAVGAAAPCILLLDGIECVAPKRGNDNTSEGTMDRVLSTFLTEMDGIESGSSDGSTTSGNVAVIGVTHNPNLIDPSLLRPGRLEKTITLGTPDFDARKEIIARQIKGIDFDFISAGYFDPKSKDDVSRFVAMESAGMSAVEVIAICREASMECLRELNFDAVEKPTLVYAHFKAAIKIMRGKRKK